MSNLTETSRPKRYVPLMVRLLTWLGGHESGLFNQGGWVSIGGVAFFCVLLLKDSTARPSGSDPVPYPVYGILAMFLTIGLVIIVGATRKGATIIRLLRNGILVTGNLQRIEDSDRSVKGSVTRTYINGALRLRFIYTFQAEDGQSHEAVALSSSDSGVETGYGRKILYDAANPSCSVVVDHLPKYVTIDGNDNVVLIASIGRIIWILIIPTFVLMFVLLAAMAPGNSH